MKKIILRIVIVLAVAAAGWWGYRLYRSMPQRQQQVASTKVRKGDVIVKSYARGELRAVRSVTLTAPNLFGTVQVTGLAPLGAFAREKDLVVEFDDSEVRSRLEEKELEIEQVDEQIKKQTADLAIRDNQDQVSLLQARYSVRRAELEVKRNELISQIDAKKNVLSLEEARQRLKQWESDIKSRQAQGRAQLDVLRQNRNKALLELAREKNRLAQVKLLAPMSGLVAVRQNRGSFGMVGMQVPDIREGDQVQPGMPVADVLDLSELEVAAKVGELDRANLHEEQDVVIALDAIPEKQFHGRIKSLSGTASANIFSSDPAKKFEVTFSVEMKELLTALGAKPEQIRKVLEQAEQNRKKPPIQAMPSMLSMGMIPGVAGGAAGAMAGGGGITMAQAGAQAGLPGAAQAGAGGEGGPGAPGGQGGQRQMRFGLQGPGGGGGTGLSEEDRNKMREAFQKALGGRSMQDLSPEERQKLMEKVREGLPANLRNLGRPQGAQGAPSATRAQSGPAAQGGQASPGAVRAEAEPGQRGERRQRGEGGGRGEGRGRGEGSGRGEGAAPGVPGMPAGFGFSAQQFSEKDLANAKLPPAPEEDTQLEVLLRPGLLADVEIIVEKIPDAIHIPNQAVFEKDGKLIAYVKSGNRFEPRVIKPLKRSESTMVIAEGLKPGETIALGDPTEKPGDKKKKEKTSGNGGGNPMGAVGGGGEKK